MSLSRTSMLAFRAGAPRVSMMAARSVAVSWNADLIVPLPSAAAAVARVSRPAVRAASSAAAPSADALEYFSVDKRENGVAVIRIDCPGESVNTLSAGMMADFDKMMDLVESDSDIKAVVLASGKPGTWVAGADIKMLAAASSAEELTGLAHNGQKAMDRIANSKKPFVAAIDGACMGGGLELALACHYRVATSNKKTVLSVPESQIGLLPGAGGTQRLPKVVGIQAALTMITTGQNIKADRAKRMGLVHEVVDPFALEHAATSAAAEILDGSLKPKTKKKALVSRLLEDNPVGRALLFKKAGEQIQKQSGGHYPAMDSIVKAVRAGVEGGYEKGSKVEREEFGKLGMTPVSEALRGIFFSMTATKKSPYGKPKHDVKQVGVLGAGLMGAGIAQVSAKANYRVVLKDQNAEALARGESQIATNLAPLVKKRRMPAFERDQLLSRVVGVTADDPVWEKHISKCDLVLEAVFESMDLKHQVVKEIEPLLRDNAVLATNTSALPIADIATAAKRPENILGMHYFSPVDKMPLLEIIPHAGTSDEALAVAFEVGRKQGKTVIIVGDVPGFYVNRCLGPFMVESIAILQEGCDPEKFDKVMKKAGFPVGPITLADEVGMDVAVKVSEFLSDKLDNRMLGADPAMMAEIVASGALGRKTGKGFFTYAKGKGGKQVKAINPEAASIIKKYAKDGPAASADDATLVARMISRFTNEAIRCLEDGIIRSPGDGDIGAVFGMGYPPFLGGPFRQVDARGAQVVADEMSRFADELGPQFAPPQLLLDHAKSGKRFHTGDGE